MVTTNNEELIQKVNALRNHRASISEEQHYQSLPPYTFLDFNLLGFNYWMTELQVACGMVQHSKIDYYIEECQRWGDCYADELANIPLLHTPSVPKDYRHGWQTYVCYIEKSEFPLSRNEIMKALYAKGIQTRLGTHAVHLLGLYRQKYGSTLDDFPVARDCDRYTMAIPLHNRMTSEDYEFAVKAIKSFGGR